jgi:hypothetical protein
MSGVLRDGLVRMMPQLAAEEDVRLAGAVAFGTGSMSKRDARKWRRAKTRELGGPGGAARKPQSVEEHHANLAAIGFSVVVNGEAVTPP